MIFLNDIQKIVRGAITVDEPMSKYTWMKVGGPADFYIEPADMNDIVELIQYFTTHHYSWIVLGRGSNVLVSDEGFRGAVINIENALSHLRIEENRVYV